MRSAFTLVELVVVIMLLGILAGIAAPKYIETSKQAKESALRQTLAVAREAIELYGASNGKLPGLTKKSDGFKTELAPYLRGDFPENPFGKSGDMASSIKIIAKGEPLQDSVRRQRRLDVR